MPPDTRRGRPPAGAASHRSHTSADDLITIALQCPVHGERATSVWGRAATWLPTPAEFMTLTDDELRERDCVLCEVVAAQAPYRCPFHGEPSQEAVDWEACEVCEWLLRHVALVETPGLACELSDCWHCQGCGACMQDVPICRVCRSCERCVPPPGAGCEGSRWSRALLREVPVGHHERFDPTTGLWP